ncbi:MAG: hypothetical protein WKF91_18550, partial [Segetibacter sp.]
MININTNPTVNPNLTCLPILYWLPLNLFLLPFWRVQNRTEVDLVSFCFLCCTEYPLYPSKAMA